MQNREKSRDDGILMDRIAAGNAAAFKEIFDRENAAVFKIAYIYLRDEALAEDIAQETFTRLWNAAKNWMPDAQVRTWLARVARNLSIDWLRKKNNDFKKSEAYFTEMNADRMRRNPPDTLNIIEEKHTNKVLRDAVFSLPERQREALILVYYMECHGAEAADIMGLTVAALESLLARARKNLRTILLEEKTDLMETIGDRS